MARPEDRRATGSRVHPAGPPKPRPNSHQKEETGENQIAQNGQQAAGGHFTNRPECEDENKCTRLADGGKRDQRPIDVLLQRQPGVRAGEEDDEERQEGCIDRWHGYRQPRELAECRRRKGEQQPAAQVENGGRPKHAPNERVFVHGSFSPATCVDAIPRRHRLGRRARPLRTQCVRPPRDPIESLVLPDGDRVSRRTGRPL